jgi:hypothetical protein
VTTVLSAVLFATTVRADEVAPKRGIAFPGSFWIAAGHVGPLEPDNTVGQSHFEQGLTIWSTDAWFVIPYLAVSYTADSLGYNWNNKHPSTVGLKLARRVRNGVVEAGGGVMFERDPATGRERHPTAYASFWSGWRADSGGHRGGRVSGYPGNMYVVSGLLTGRDPRNWVTVMSAQQGILVYKWRGIAVVPHVAALASVDTKQRNWENRVSYDGGVKLARHFSGGVIEGGVVQRRQHQFRTNRVASAPVVFVNFWIGWNPSAINSP